MATDRAQPAGASGASANNSFDLQILSPSPNVPQPLVLQGVPVSTTVRQLKDKVRNSLDSKPADSAQRLILRGHLLAREDDTMLDVFGEEAIRTGDRQSLHLVLREIESQPDVSSHPTPQIPGSRSMPDLPNPRLRPQAQAQQPGNEHGQAQPTPAQQNNPFGFAAPQVHVRIGHGPWPNMTNIPNATQAGFPQQPVPGMAGAGHPANLPPGYTNQQFAQHQMQWTAAMNAQMGQRRMEELLAQTRAAELAAAHAQGIPVPASSVRNSSPLRQDATRTVLREGVGPNGQQWRVVTNEAVPNPMMRTGRTGSPFSGEMQNMFRPPTTSSYPQQPRSVPTSGPFGGNDLQNILHQADANQATRTLTDAMRRNASTSSLASLGGNHAAAPIHPGVTVPSRTASAAGTPDPLRASSFGRVAFPFQPPPTQATAPPQTRNPEVYILSSPTGPRALLVNSDQQQYFTPQGRGPMSGAFGSPVYSSLLNTPMYSHLHSNLFSQPAVPQQPTTFNAGANPGTPAPQTPQAQDGQPLAPQGLPPPPQGGAQADNVVAQPAAAPPGAQPQEMRVIPIWPHVWMIIRLCLFVWWFTSPESSWSRWFTVVSIACGLFLVNTGILNPLIDQFWVPLRRHIENLMPLADNHGRGQRAGAGAAANAAGHDAGAAQREPNPADAAARMINQRRAAPAYRILDIVRRLERAGLIFLASIAPGIAERHIEHLEAEARAERQRLEAQAEAAATAEAEAAAAAATQETQEDGTAGADAGGESATAGVSAGGPSADMRNAGGDFEATAPTGELRQRPVAETQVD